ncbi:MAG: lipoyl(octanoyl) transferase [Chloroflexi bacterium RBG_16_68_14]|nr:MAG: lipoyl(octanoyl) transferase [Chloroflexi bacterium RBG_16_68_14]
MQTNGSTVPCTVHRLGLVEYQEAWAEQRRLVEACRADGRGRLLLLEHPPTYTFGVRGRSEHLLLREEALAQIGATVHRIDRGGDVTFHGPGQLVAYPILDLRRWRQGPLWYVRSLEAVLIEALSTFAIAGRRVPGRPGVWVGEAKIAAIGVRVSRGITSHGFALNVEPDLRYFSYIIPCGLPGVAVTSMAEVLRQRGASGISRGARPFAFSSLTPPRQVGAPLSLAEGEGPGGREDGRIHMADHAFPSFVVPEATGMDAVMDAVVAAFARVFPVELEEAPVGTAAAAG